jgi:hypothetical protein
MLPSLYAVCVAPKTFGCVHSAVSKALLLQTVCLNTNAAAKHCLLFHHCPLLAMTATASPIVLGSTVPQITCSPAFGLSLCDLAVVAIQLYHYCFVFSAVLFATFRLSYSTYPAYRMPPCCRRSSEACHTGLRSGSRCAPSVKACVVAGWIPRSSGSIQIAAASFHS